MPLHTRASAHPFRLPAAALSTAVAAAMLLGAAAPARAAEGASVTVVLDTPGAPSAATLPGWTLSHGANNTAEAEVVGDALRLSNARSIPFTASLKTPPLSVAAGEATGVNTFDATVSIASQTGGYQAGLNTEIALDDGNFTRNGGLVSLLHQDGVLKIGTFSLSDTVPTTNPASSTYLWDETVFAAVDPAVAHTLRIVATFVAGPDNDVVEYYVDGALAFTGPSWERLSEVKQIAPPYFPVDRLAFSSGKSTASVAGMPVLGNVPPVPALAGAGFLFSGIAYSSYTVAPAPSEPTPVPPIEQVPPLAPAPEAAPDAPIELPAAASAGQTISIEAAGFAPFENVHFTWYSEPLFAGWAQADARGVVSARFVIPAELASGTAHTLQGVGEYSGFVANAQIAIAAAPAADGPGRELAATGTQDAAAIAGGGGLLVALGAAAVLALRRRRA